MKFQASFLVRLIEDDGGWAAVCDGAGLPVYGETRAEAMTAMEEELRTFLDTEGPDYIRALNQQTAGDRQLVPCPEAQLKLPVDVWYCKVTKDICPVQGTLDLNSLPASLQVCNAPVDTREGIVVAFERGGYPGLHHITGKWLCPTCNFKVGNGRNYHHRFSLTLLPQLLNLSTEQRDDLRRRVILGGIDVTVMHGALCPDCILAVMTKLGEPYQIDAAAVHLEVSI